MVAEPLPFLDALFGCRSELLVQLLQPGPGPETQVQETGNSLKYKLAYSSFKLCIIGLPANGAGTNSSNGDSCWNSGYELGIGDDRM